MTKEEATKKAQELHANGTPFSSIQEVLEKEGFKLRNGKSPSYGTVRLMALGKVDQKEDKKESKNANGKDKPKEEQKPKEEKIELVSVHDEKLLAIKEVLGLKLVSDLAKIQLIKDILK